MSAAVIHPSAIIEEGAKISEGCVIGPFCHGPSVTLGPRVMQEPRCGKWHDRNRYGYGCVPFSVLGEIPQDLKFKGEATSLKIGRVTVYANMLR